MTTNICLTILAVLSLNAIVARAGPPDWVPAELIDMVQDDKKRCMDEHGTSQAEIDKVNDGILENTKTISCYMYCLLDAFSLVDEDGVLDAEMLLSFIPEDLQAMGSDILNKCAKQDGADNCDRIYHIAKCVQGMVPELWFMV